MVEYSFSADEIPTVSAVVVEVASHLHGHIVSFV